MKKVKIQNVDSCKENQILIEAWSLLRNGKILSNSILCEIAGRYHKSVAQICIRWCLKNGVLSLPKSIASSCIIENVQVLGFEITKKDMEFMNSFPYLGGSGNHPDKVKF